MVMWTVAILRLVNLEGSISGFSRLTRAAGKHAHILGG